MSIEVRTATDRGSRDRSQAGPPLTGRVNKPSAARVRALCSKVGEVVQVTDWLAIADSSDTLGLDWVIDFGNSDMANEFHAFSDAETACNICRDSGDEPRGKHGYPEVRIANRIEEWLDRHDLEFVFQVFRSDLALVGLRSRDRARREGQARRNSFLWNNEILREDAGVLYSEIEAAVKSPTFMSESMDWRAFEVMVRSVFRNQGFDTFLGRGSNDGGIDLILTEHSLLGPIKLAVQMKRYSRRNVVDLQSVQAIYGAASDEFDGAVHVTSSRYLPSVRGWAETRRNTMRLIDGDELRVLLDAEVSPIVRHATSPTSSPTHVEQDHYRKDGPLAKFWASQAVGRFLGGMLAWDDDVRQECLIEVEHGLWKGPNGLLFEAVQSATAPVSVTADKRARTRFPA